MNIMEVQKPVDHSVKGSSAWIRLIRETPVANTSVRTREGATQ